jgi:hypothetical protein
MVADQLFAMTLGNGATVTPFNWATGAGENFRGATLSETMTVSITMTRGTEHISPEGIMFKAVATGYTPLNLNGAANAAPDFTDPTFVWDFGPNAGGTFNNVAKMLTEWNTRREAYGPFVGRTFPAGTHTVTVYVLDTDGATYATSTVVFTVADWQTEYTGSDVICVCANSGDALAGSTHVTTLAAAETAYEAQSNPGIVLLRRGE